MASPITTAGFQVSERLNPQFLDPRLLTPQYGSLIPAVSQGLGAAGQFAQIYENAQQAPVRRRLAQIQLEEGEGRLARAPIDRQIDELRLLQLQQPIVRETGRGIEEVPRYELQPMVDELGQPMLDASGAPRMERPAGADSFEVIEEQFYDPVAKTFTTRKRRVKPLQTLEQAAALDEKEAISRLREESLQQSRLLKSKLDQERLNSPSWKKTGYAVDENGFVVYTIMNEKTRETDQIRTNLTPAQSGLDAAITRFVGGQPGAPAAGQRGMFRVNTGAPDAVPADSDFRAVIDEAVGAFTVPEIGAPRAFATEAEAQAEAAAGRLKRGTKITIGGAPGTWN